jgi:hypothetical protein
MKTELAHDVESGMLPDEKLEHVAYLSSGLLLGRHQAGHLRVHGRQVQGGRVRPVEVVEDEPAAGPQELLDEKERESVRIPIMSTIDEAEVELRMQRSPVVFARIRCMSSDVYERGVRTMRARSATPAASRSGATAARCRGRS